MPSVFPFNAVQYAKGSGNIAQYIAPPYDVLDAKGKQALLDFSGSNIVRIDLPHTPAKELGPPAAYEAAGNTYRAWLADGTLTKRDTPALFAYRQSFRSADGSIHRRSGMACTVETLPFGPRAGGGILPHEETFSGPKEDRLALMKATQAQLSPIFGLHADDHGKATALLQAVMSKRPPDLTADSTWAGQHVSHEVWTITDAPTIKAYQDALAGEDVFIADGHHRYNTALNYIKHLESKGAVPADHPARRCMMVLVGMSDPGLVIWPTHRVLGGMKSYTFDAFCAHAKSSGLQLEPVAGDLAAVEHALHTRTALGDPRVAVVDMASGKSALLSPGTPDPLAAKFPAKPKAWRLLDVAFIQYSLVEAICQPKLNGGEPVKWAFPHTIPEVADIARGHETGAGGGKGFAQLAVIVRPTPLSAVKDVSRAGELMPQKSTFFYPKLATGLFINALSH